MSATFGSGWESITDALTRAGIAYTVVRVPVIAGGGNAAANTAMINDLIADDNGEDAGGKS